jgi:C4-dicarboxylate transporter DctQ subunit
MQKFLRGLYRLEEYTLTITLLGLAVVACGQVFSRYALGISFGWFEEGGRYIGIAITFIGAAIGARRGSHFAMDLFVTTSRPAISRTLRTISGLLSASFLLIVAYYGFKLVLRNYDYENLSPAMQLPMYLMYLPIPFFSFVMGLRFLFKAIDALRGVEIKKEGSKL